MCAPMIVVGAMMLASAAMSAKSQKDTGEYNEAVADQNVKIQEWKATDAIQRGDIAANNIQLRTAQQISGIRAQAAANGGNVDFGSNVDMQESTAKLGALDTITMRSNARREAFGDQVGAMNSDAQGALDLYSGNTQAQGTILSGVAKAYGGYKGMQ